MFYIFLHIWQFTQMPNSHTVYIFFQQVRYILSEIFKEEIRLYIKAFTDLQGYKFDIDTDRHQSSLCLYAL